MELKWACCEISYSVFVNENICVSTLQLLSTKSIRSPSTNTAPIGSSRASKGSRDQFSLSLKYSWKLRALNVVDPLLDVM